VIRYEEYQVVQRKKIYGWVKKKFGIEILRPDKFKRAVNPQRRALRNVMMQVGVSSGRQKRKIRKWLNRELRNVGSGNG
jgi:hypothetical protein